MKTIIETYQQLNESFQSKYVRMIAQDASLLNMNFDKFKKDAYINFVAWDKVTDDDVEIMDISTEAAKEDALKLLHALGAGKPNYWSVTAKKRIDFKSNWTILFGYKDDKLIFIFNPKSGISFCAVNTDGRFNRNRLDIIDRARERDNVVLNCDTLYIFSIDKYDSTKLTNDRSRSVYGMVPDLDKYDREVKASDKQQGVLGKVAGGLNIGDYYLRGGGKFFAYCNNLVRDAKEKWQKIIASNKFKRTADTKEIDDLVSDTMNKYFTFVQESMKAAATNKKISEFRIKDLAALVTGKARSNKYNDYGWLEGGLLNIYGEYTKVNVSLAQDDRYADSEVRQRDSYASHIKEISKRISDQIEALKKEWGM